MYTLSDADVKLLLEELKLDADQAGAKDAGDRLKLLQNALQKTQHLGKLLKQVSDSSSPDAQLDPRSLKRLDSRSQLLTQKFHQNEMFSMQEKMSVQFMPLNMRTAWFELRVTLCEVVENHVKQGITRVCISDSSQPRKMGGVIDILGARVTPDGKVPVLETRHRFYCTQQVTKEFAAVEKRTTPSGPVVVVTVEPKELKLLAMLLDANASRLCPRYVSAQQSAWGTGSNLTPSFLLPVEPLTQHVTLGKQCHVCGQEDAMACAGCRTVAYCGKDCQTKDWKQHKAACKAAQAAAATTESSVVINLQEAVLDVPYITGIRMNTSVQDMLQSARSNVTTGQAASGAAPDVARNPARRFIVKVQAPLSGGNMPLYLYDQKRKVQAYINSNQQPAAGTLLGAIRKHGWMGCKLFAWAALETDKQLRVFTEPLPSQTQTW